MHKEAWYEYCDELKSRWRSHCEEQSESWKTYCDDQAHSWMVLAFAMMFMGFVLGTVVGSLL